jgi:nudix-type nucleoside diphosphatase (YffH/AdpP family)
VACLAKLIFSFHIQRCKTSPKDNHWVPDFQVSLFSKEAAMENILSVKKVFDNSIIIEEAQIERIYPSGKKKEFSRLRLRREDAAVVFIYNTESDKVVLTRQFRYPIADKVKEPIYELVAGKVEHGNTPLQTAINESMEEAGYAIKPKNTELLTSGFSSPGYSSEKFYLYYTCVTNADRLTAGGGLEEENESIEVVEMNYDVFMQLIDEGKIEDIKTILGAFYVRWKRSDGRG